jgi:hypothetical protein
MCRSTVFRTQTAAVTFAAGTPTAGNSSIAASPTAVVANEATKSTITVTLKDAFGNATSGKTVTLAQGRRIIFKSLHIVQDTLRIAFGNNGTLPPNRQP